MRVAARLAPLALEQVLPDGSSRRVALGSFWDAERPGGAPRAVVLVFLRHFG
jgi:hypothetical protein